MLTIDFKKIKKIYFAGIGGIGVSAIARFMLANKKIVIGSELNESETVDQLRNLGIKIIIGQKAENITKDIDLLVYSPALPDGHPERVMAKKLKIKELSYPEILGILSKQYNTIAISGTHGKSTTTAITGMIFETAKKDPNVMVGSKLKH
jgi:UDP-N-acetylmuramate--alanine ligase